MDLVVGATGVVGRQAALELRKRGRAVRALVRSGAARAEAQSGAERRASPGMTAREIEATNRR